MNVRPSDWAPTRLGDVLTFQVGFPFRSEHFATVPLGPRLIRNRDLRSDDSIVHYTGRYSKDYIVEPGDVLVGMDGDFSPCVWPTGQALLNQRVGRLRVSQRACSRFLAYALAGPLRALEGATGATTVKHLSHRDVESIVLPLPAKAEQERIASALESADAVIDALRISISKKQAIKQGMMQELLTGRTRLPGFNRAWSTAPLKVFFPLQRGFDLPTTKVRPGPYPVVYSNGIARTHSTAMVKGPGVATGRSGTIGKVHYIEGDYWPHNTTLWVTSFDHTNAKFAYYFLNHLGLERFASGSGVPTFNRNDAHGFEVSVPADVEEQIAIAEALTDIDKEIEQLVRRHEKATSIKIGMMQELLTGRSRLAIAEGKA